MYGTKQRPTRRKSVLLNERVLIKQYRLINGHECSLPIAEDALSMYLNDGPFVLLRRKFKQMFLISETVPKTKLFFRSSLRIGMEKQRHLRYYYYTIHPFSKFRYYWEIFMALILLLITIYLPVYGINFENPLQSDWDYDLYSYLCFFCFFDIIVNCFTGYIDKKSDSVVLNLRQVFKQYLFGYMIIDVIATLPTTTIFGYYLSRTAQHWMIINRYARVLRLITAITYLDNLLELLNVQNQKRHIIVRLLVFAVFVEYFTFVAILDRTWIINQFNAWQNINTFFCKSTYLTLRTFFLIKPHFSGLKEGSWFGLLHQFVLLQCGNLFNAFMIARFHAIYNRTNLISRKHERLAGQVQEYARFKGLPDATHRILLQFVDFKFGRRIYDEDLILSSLSPHLRDELFFLYSQKLMKNVELFKDMPTSAIKRIAVRLKQEIILPNDVIIQAGHEGSSMYFIIAGIVAVYTISGKEVCHLTDGANFGEIALLMNETRTASIVATDFCEVFKLHRKDFQEAIQPFPELKEKIIQTTMERFRTIISFPAQDNDVPDVR